MVIRSARKPKKTWAKAKAQSIRLVGRCRYCKKEITNDESFVCFADKTCGHYECMRLDDEKKPTAFDW
tara:strand:- start:786 stop:989 length:204 start_codon:yes stop_codon:yes gene_type:complete